MSFAHNPAPKVHPLINPIHLQTNGKLLTDRQIRLVEEVLEDENTAVFAAAKMKELIESHAWDQEPTAEDKQLPFRILKIKNAAGERDTYFAIYMGEKQGKALGAGAGGKVKLIQDLYSGELYALKVISYDRTAASNEFKILDILKESCGVVAEKNITGEFSAGKFYFIMRLGKGKNLLSLLEEHANGTNRLSTADWLNICDSILKAVHDVHQKGVYHRDLKLENILYDPETKAVKIVDFGTACLFSKEKPEVRDYPHGTEGYMAPEIEEHGRFSEKSEIFALGVLFKELLGYKPFKNSEDESEIPAQNNSARTDLSKLNEELYALLKKMTRSKPEKRSTLLESYQMLNLINTQFLNSLKQAATMALTSPTPSPSPTSTSGSTSSTNSASTSTPASFFSPNSSTLSAAISDYPASPNSTTGSPKRKKSNQDQEQKTGSTANVGNNPLPIDKKTRF